jgi:hypothetical protein
MEAETVTLKGGRQLTIGGDGGRRQRADEEWRRRQ